MQKEKDQSQINQSFGIICHTEVCLTFSRLAAKLSEMITKFWGRNSKCNIKCPLTSMASKMVWPKNLKIASNQCKSSKYWWEVWILGRRRKKNQTSSAVKSDHFRMKSLPACLLVTRFSCLIHRFPRWTDGRLEKKILD